MGIPRAIASDDGGEFTGRFKEILDVEGIDHFVFTTHLSVIDRFTRTINNMLYERVQHTKKTGIYCSQMYLNSIIIQYIIQPNLSL